MSTDTLIASIVLGIPALLLVITLASMRRRWYLLQHISDPNYEWMPMKLLVVAGLPICFLVYRVYGPWKNEETALKAAREFQGKSLAELRTQKP